MFRYLAMAALLLGGVALTACTSANAASKAAPSASSGNTVTVKALDSMRFNPDTITVKAGTPVKLTLDDSGQALIHDWTVESLDGKRIHVQANPGQKNTVEFTPTEPGTYQVYCSQPGHKEAGMVARLVVN